MENGNYSAKISVIDGFSSVLKSFNQQMKISQAPVKRLQTQLKQFNNLTGIRHTANNFTELTGRIRNATDASVNLLKQLTAISAIGSIGGAAAALHAAGASANSARLTGNQMGVSGATVLQQRSASRLLGVGEDTLTKTYSGVQDMQREVANGGNADASQILSSMGISASQAGHMDPTKIRDMFLSHARQEQRTGMDSSTIRAQFSAMHVDSNLMGMDASKVQGAEAQAKSLSGVTQPGIKSLEGMDLSSRKLQETIQGFGMTIAQKVSPSVTKLIDEFQTWITTSPEAKQAFDNVSNALVSVATWVANLPFKKLYDDIKPVLPSFHTLKTILEGLVAVKVVGWVTGIIAPIASLGVSALVTGYRIASFAVTSVASLGQVAVNAARTAASFVMSGGLVRAAATAMRVAITTATGPIGIAVAGIALAAYEIYQHWDKVGPYFKKLWEGIKLVFGVYIKGIKAEFKFFGQIFSPVWDGIKNTFSKGWDFVSRIFDKIKGAVGWAVKHIPGMSKAFNMADTAIGSAKAVASDLMNTSSDASDNDGSDNTSSAAAKFQPAPETKVAGSQAHQAFGVAGRLQQLGLSNAAAFGAAANIMKESNFNAGAVGDKGAAFGIGQWHKDRQDAISKHFGMDIHKMNLDQQLQAYAWEMGTSQGGNVLSRLKGVTDPRAAAAIISKYGERPADQAGEMKDRANIAANISGHKFDNRSDIMTGDMSSNPIATMNMSDVMLADASPSQSSDNGSINITVGIDESNKIFVSTKTTGDKLKNNNPIVVSKRPVMSNMLV